MDDFYNWSRSEFIAEVKRLNQRIKELEQNERWLRSELDDALSNGQKAAREFEVVYREHRECKNMQKEYNEMKALVESLTKENQLLNGVAASTPNTSFNSFAAMPNFSMLNRALTTMRMPYAPVQRPILPPITASPATTQNSTVQKRMAVSSSTNSTPRVSYSAQRMSSSGFPSSMKKRTDSSLAEKSTQLPSTPEPSVIAPLKMPPASSANSIMQLPDSGMPQRKTSSTSTPNSTLQRSNSVMASPKVPSVTIPAATASAQPSDSDLVQRDSSANSTMRVFDPARKLSASGFPGSMRERSDSTLAQKSMSPPSTPAKLPSASTPELVQKRMTHVSSVNSTMQLPESDLTSPQMPPAAFPSSMKKRSDSVLPQASSSSTPNSTIQPSYSVMASPKVPSASTPQMIQRQCVSSVNSTLQLPESILASTKIPSSPVQQKQSVECLHISPANNTVSASSSKTSTAAVVKEKFNPFISQVEQTGPPPPPPRSTSIRSELSDSSMSSSSSDETETEETTNIQVQPRPIVLRSFPAPRKSNANPRPAISPLYTDDDGNDGSDSEASYKRGRSFDREFDDASPRSSAAFARNIDDQLDNRTAAQRERSFGRNFDEASSAVAKNVNDHLDNKSPVKHEMNSDDATIGGSRASFSEVEYTDDEFDDDVPNTNMHDSVANGNATLQEIKEDDDDVPSTNTTMRPSGDNDNAAALRKKKEVKEPAFDRKVYYNSSDEEDHSSPAWYS